MLVGGGGSARHLTLLTLILGVELVHHLFLLMGGAPCLHLLKPGYVEVKVVKEGLH